VCAFDSHELCLHILRRTPLKVVNERGRSPSAEAAQAAAQAAAGHRGSEDATYLGEIEYESVISTYSLLPLHLGGVVKVGPLSMRVHRMHA